MRGAESVTVYATRSGARRWNPAGELFGYIKNQLYAPLFPSHALLRAGGGAAPAKPAAKPAAKPVPVRARANGLVSAAKAG